jgi:predicted amidohydrolase YtcJ
MAREDEKQSGFSRRDFIKGAALAAGGAVLGGAASGTVVEDAAAAGASSLGKGPSACDGLQDLALINGRFLTMDDKDSVVSAVAIRNGRIAEVGRHTQAIGPCAQTINLRGATVIPGLIDSHVHFVRCGLNPGHEVRIIETATSLAELQQMISERAQTVPPGEFITCVGGWNRNGLAERRLPTLSELDAAASQNPVYLTETGGGGAGVTNTSGKTFFESNGVTVDTTTGVLNAAQGFIALRQAELAGDPIVSNRLTGTEEVIDFVSGLGMTMVHDVGGNGGFAGNPTLFVDLKPYDQALDLWRENDLKLRMRVFLYSDIDPGFDIARTRMDNNLIRLGDDIFGLLGVGERVNVSTTDPGFIGHCVYAATHGWTVQQHSSNQEEITLHVRAFQVANDEAPIEKLRWSLTHVNSITDDQIQALIAMRTGVTIQGTAHTSGTATGGSGGTPFRRILDQMGAARIPVGGGSDATNVGPLNPWLMMSFMTTGKNNAGVVINTPGQSCTRLEALRMYTIGSAYFSFDDHELGSIEKGKLADLAVLSGNPLTVSDEEFKKLESVLTLQAGKIVHGSSNRPRQR